MQTKALSQKLPHLQSKTNQPTTTPKQNKKYFKSFYKKIQKNMLPFEDRQINFKQE